MQGAADQPPGQAPCTLLLIWLDASLHRSRALEGRAGIPDRWLLLEVPWMCLRKQTAALTARDQVAEEIAQRSVGHTTFGPDSRCNAQSTPTALCPARAMEPPRCISGGCVGGRRTTVPALHDLGSNLGSSASSLELQTNLSFSQQYSAQAKISKSRLRPLPCHLWPCDLGQITRSLSASIPHLFTGNDNIPTRIVVVVRNK